MYDNELLHYNRYYYKFLKLILVVFTFYLHRRLCGENKAFSPQILVFILLSNDFRSVSVVF
jgi:hypothetical protein